jgi:Na+-driven multidrug efflux pump
MGAHIIAIRIESFSYLPGFAIGTAAATLVGQYLGAGAPRVARRAILICAGITSALMGVAGIVFVLAPASIVSLISAQPAHLELAPALLFITGWVQVPFGLSIVFRSALRGAGDAKAVAYLMWISTYAIRLPLAYALSGVSLPAPTWIAPSGIIAHPFFDHPSLARLWIALCFEIVVRALLYSARFAQGRWATARV